MVNSRPMGILDRVRSVFRSPADRRIEAAWKAAPAPSAPLATRAAAPFGGGMFPSPPGPPQRIDWYQDQPPPQMAPYAFRPGYSDHTYANLSAPQGFEGFTLERIRNAVALHRMGIFLESSALLVACLGFGPLLAAFAQAIAPILALPRHVHGGDKGLARMVKEEITEQLVPAHGLLPSPNLPPEIWGTMAIYLRWFGFAVLQHVDGEPDEDTGVRERYTRLFDPWAVTKTRKQPWIAQTTGGPVEIKNDGKFTLVFDETEPHFTGAACALGEEVLGGKLTQEQRLQWQDFFASPKLYATLPEKVPTQGQAGDAFTYAVETIYGPDGRGVLPYGSTLQAVTYGAGTGASQFQDAILDHIVHIFMVLTGSAGTIGNGMNTGAGQGYQPVKGGAWTVAHHLVARPTIAMVRGLNEGHVRPYYEGNYPEQVKAARRAGTWVDPTLRIPLVAPDREERIAGTIGREKARCEISDMRRASGYVVTDDDERHLAEDLEVRPLKRADATPRVGEIFQYHIESKLVAPDEVRDRLGLAPLPDGAGSVERLAAERIAGKDEVGTKASQGDPEIDGKPPTVPDDAEPAAAPPAGGSGGTLGGASAGEGAATGAVGTRGREPPAGGEEQT